MSDQQSAAPENITFEGGYEELKGIVARLGSDDVSVHEMFEGFRRGKGLEKSLRGYLQEREGELTEIEQGHNLPQFNIVPPEETGDAAPAEPPAAPDFQSPGGSTDDDIPF
jgi:exodeoxyribonuclease VII small subunit